MKGVSHAELDRVADQNPEGVNDGQGGRSRPYFQPSGRRFDMWTDKEVYDRFGDIPVILFFLLLLWPIGFVIENPDVIKDAAARAIRAIGRRFKRPRAG